MLGIGLLNSSLRQVPSSWVLLSMMEAYTISMESIQNHYGGSRRERMELMVL